jgi:hypothetical protein
MVFFTQVATTSVGVFRVKALSQTVTQPSEVAIENRILFVRGHKVMMDRDLAELYGVTTKVLNKAAKRNSQRFPEDFLFQLTLEEGRQVLRSQIVTLKTEDGRGRHRKYAPYVFTELGVAMLSSMLGSERAIMANISIMRIFVKLRQTQLNQEQLGQRLDQIEWQQSEQGEQIRAVFETIEQLISPPAEADRKRIGFPTSQIRGKALASSGA